MSLLQQGKWAKAEAVLRECLAIREKGQPDEWSTFNTRSTLGGSLLGQKKYDEAEPLIVSGYEGMKAREAKIPPPGKPRLAEAAVRVVKLYEDWGKPDKAAEWRAKLAKAVRRAQAMTRRPGRFERGRAGGMAGDVEVGRRLARSAGDRPPERPAAARGPRQRRTTSRDRRRVRLTRQSRVSEPGAQLLREDATERQQRPMAIGLSEGFHMVFTVTLRIASAHLVIWRAEIYHHPRRDFQILGVSAANVLSVFGGDCGWMFQVQDLSQRRNSHKTWRSKRSSPSQPSTPSASWRISSWNWKPNESRYLASRDEWKPYRRIVRDAATSAQDPRVPLAKQSRSLKQNCTDNTNGVFWEIICDYGIMGYLVFKSGKLVFAGSQFPIAV